MLSEVTVKAFLLQIISLSNIFQNPYDEASICMQEGTENK